MTLLNTTPLPRIPSAEIERKIQKSHPMNGAVVIAYGDENIYAHEFGIADQSAHQLWTKDTQFFIASVTKQFTAAALLHVLNGFHSSLKTLKEALQKPLVLYLPSTHSIWDDSMPEWANKVTLHHLLTHTSGITAVPRYKSVAYTPTCAREIANMFKTEPLNFEPGTHYQYGNSGYFLLGEIIAHLSEKNLSQYLADNFFNPLGMKNSFMSEVGNGGVMKESGNYPNLARGYTCDLKPNSPMVEIEKYVPNIFLNAAGAIVSTVNDLIIWNHSLHHNIVLPTNVTELMLTEHVQMDSQNTSNYYCYGIMKTKYSNGDIFTHDGDIDGFITTVTYRPCDQLSFISCTNVNIYISQIAAAFNREYENFKHIENQKDFDTAVDAVLETEFPGFLTARTKYDRLQLKDMVPLEKE